MMPTIAEEQSPKTEAVEASEKWSGFDLTGLVIQSESAQSLRMLEFKSGGFVSAFIGTKPPGEEWRYSKETWTCKTSGDDLEILDSNKKVRFRLRPAKAGAREIRANVGHGETETFQVIADGPPPPRPKKLKWQEFDLFSRALDLKSRTDVEWYYFHRDGSVSATIGKKKGGIAGPLWYWRYSGDWLQIFGEDGEVYRQMRLSKIGEKEITVDCSLGQTKVFELKRLDGSPEEAPPPGSNGAK